MATEEDCCSCNCKTNLGKMEVTGNLFIAASVFMLIITILWILGEVLVASESGFQVGSMDYNTLGGELLLLYSSILLIIAATYLKYEVTQNKETYDKILADTYADDVAGVKRDCCTSCCFTNTYQVVGWLVFAALLPIVFFPTYFPLILFFFFIVVCLFLAAVSPAKLIMNYGRGSIGCCDQSYDQCGCGCCCRTYESRRPVASDVTSILLTMAIFAIFFLISAIINVSVLSHNSTAWLWVISSTLLVIGLFMWHHATMPPKEMINEEERLIPMATGIVVTSGPEKV